MLFSFCFFSVLRKNYIQYRHGVASNTEYNMSALLLLMPKTEIKQQQICSTLESYAKGVHLKWFVVFRHPFSCFSLCIARYSYTKNSKSPFSNIIQPKRCVYWIMRTFSQLHLHHHLHYCIRSSNTARNRNWIKKSYTLYWCSYWSSLW